MVLTRPRQDRDRARRPASRPSPPRARGAHTPRMRTPAGTGRPAKVPGRGTNRTDSGSRANLQGAGGEAAAEPPHGGKGRGPSAYARGVLGRRGDVRGERGTRPIGDTVDRRDCDNEHTRTIALDIQRARCLVTFLKVFFRDGERALASQSLEHLLSDLLDGAQAVARSCGAVREAVLLRPRLDPGDRDPDLVED